MLILVVAMKSPGLIALAGIGAETKNKEAGVSTKLLVLPSAARTTTSVAESDTSSPWTRTYCEAGLGARAGAGVAGRGVGGFWAAAGSATARAAGSASVGMIRMLSLSLFARSGPPSQDRIKCTVTEI